MDLTKLNFVNNYGENWIIEYNDYLWNYFSYHGRTPNGEPLDFPTYFNPEREGKEL